MLICKTKTWDAENIFIGKVSRQIGTKKHKNRKYHAGSFLFRNFYKRIVFSSCKNSLFKTAIKIG